tara:strand:- start:2311 stop:3057 length:747 start_codon:yes stop_codon:yes gene_type:complete
MANYDFSDKVLVLTGSSGGIGRATAKYFYDCGAKLVLSYRNDEKIKEFVREFDPNSSRSLLSQVDLTSSSECNRFASACKERFGHADFLVNNAAVLRMAPVSTMSDEIWREVVAANLDSVFFMCRAFLPILKDGGAIVNIASTAAHRGAIDHSAYAATKAGVLTFSRSLAREEAPRIRCNGLSPGMVNTEMLGELPEDVLKMLRDESPYQRLAHPEEIASAIAFLCSDDSTFITGETLHVNGACYIPS